MNLKLGSLYVLPLFALQIVGSGCNRANPQAAGPQLPPPPLVSVVKAQAQDVPVYLDEIGRALLPSRYCNPTSGRPHYAKGIPGWR